MIQTKVVRSHSTTPRHQLLSKYFNIANYKIECWFFVWTSIMIGIKVDICTCMSVRKGITHTTNTFQITSTRKQYAYNICVYVNCISEWHATNKRLHTSCDSSLERTLIKGRMPNKTCGPKSVYGIPTSRGDLNQCTVYQHHVWT